MSRRTRSSFLDNEDRFTCARISMRFDFVGFGYGVGPDGAREDAGDVGVGLAEGQGPADCHLDPAVASDACELVLPELRAGPIGPDLASPSPSQSLLTCRKVGTPKAWSRPLASGKPARI